MDTDFARVHPQIPGRDPAARRYRGALTASAERTEVKPQSE
jgi:hypothetical protein